ncbi:pseudouridine synthase [Solidesulfovibrio sp.]|uniref:pseudouridine synthase family protein n=1 Tax=Solidesulfovibrio sp. TaxID=2910990 RepID=UPI00260AD4F6|nr:pseudouridine synthase [Solidesulfovibrio sp.]
MNDGKDVLVDAVLAGERLDKATALLWPAVGLRGRRRLIEAGRALVDGRPREAAYRLRAGEKLAALAAPATTNFFSPEDVPILFRGQAYAAVSKPAGLHSAAIAHGGGESLEAMLPHLFPGTGAVLLSRLDKLTSGIVPVALAPEAAARYRRVEDAGRVEKTYLCVVHGRIDAPFVADFRLDAADRAKTRVLPRSDPDPLRHTAVTPLEGGEGTSLVSCRIAKGARHQIRAHLAAAGHPLVGDPLYGQGEAGGLYLHCVKLSCPEFEAGDAPPWTVADAAATVEGAKAKGAE